MSGDMFTVQDRKDGRLGMLVLAFVAFIVVVLAFVVGLNVSGGDAGASTPSTTVAAPERAEAYQLRCMMTPAGGQ